jgi:hypothetical protein
MMNSTSALSNSYNPYSMNTGSAAMQQSSIPAQQTSQRQGDSAPPKDTSIQSKIYSNSGLIAITIGGVLLSLLIGVLDVRKSLKKG